VIAGELRGRRLVTPPEARPTTDRVRESVFGTLAAQPGALAGVTVLDLYAGSGALAFEALSRGASRAVLVERDPDAVAVVRANVTTLDLAARARVLARPVAAVLAAAPVSEAPFGLVCCDPPYDVGDEEVADVLRALEMPGWLTPEALVVVERPAPTRSGPTRSGPTRSGPPAWPAGWTLAWERGYGDTLVVALARAD